MVFSKNLSWFPLSHPQRSVNYSLQYKWPFPANFSKEQNFYLRLKFGILSSLHAGNNFFFFGLYKL